MSRYERQQKSLKVMVDLLVDDVLCDHCIREVFRRLIAAGLMKEES